VFGIVSELFQSSLATSDFSIYQRPLRSLSLINSNTKAHKGVQRVYKGCIGVQNVLNNIIFVLSDADINLRIIILDLADRDLVCLIISASSDKLELIS